MNLKYRLKPYVHKIKGAKNYAFYDLMNGNFYSIKPEGDLEQFKKSLLELGLTFETRGTVPFKTTFDLNNLKDVLQVRELQIRLNGFKEDNCLKRNKMSGEKQFMSVQTLSIVKEQVSKFPVTVVRLEMDTLDSEKIEFVLTDFTCSDVLAVVQNGLDSCREECQRLLNISNCNNKTLKLVSKEEIDPCDLNVSIFNFFYNKMFNPCLGHKVAVDCNGDIKPCLWWHDSLGNVENEQIQKLIFLEKFDIYWVLKKDKIDTCKDCELRYACKDCRLTQHEGEPLPDKKPAYCSYNPYAGAYEENLHLEPLIR